MQTRMFTAMLLTCALLPCAVAAKEKDKPPAKPAAPIGWLDLHAGARNFSISEEDLQKVKHQIARGALVPVFKTKQKHDTTLARVGVLNLKTGNGEVGWVEIKPDEVKPAESYPTDSELLRLLGAPYLDDFTADHTDIARFLVRQSQGNPALLCYVFTAPLSMAKFVIFTPDEGSYSPTTQINVPISDMTAGITSIEVRDLLGDGSDCVITKEHFREFAQTSGTILRIRHIADGKFQEMWQAPIEFRNMSQFNPKMHILQPPERNIGAAGTVTTGDVTFRPAGRGEEPVWKGKVDFFVFGREKAINHVNIEKACPWKGEVFAPLR